jgi:hypothetical protein
MSVLSTTLLRQARSIAGQLTSLAKVNAPKHLQAGISSHVVEEGEGQIRITLETKGADARAQEYGSGLQDRKHPHKYPIVGKPWLAFMPTNGYLGNAYGAYDPNTRQGVGEKNVFITHQVMHPGIHAVNDGQGYVRPALKEFRRTLKEGNFPEEIKQAIVSDIRRSFRGND